MRRIVASLLLGTGLTVSAAAQCLNTGSPGNQILAGDDAISTQQALGFTYPNPIGGALAAGYTHCLVSTNGWIVLTDGVGTGNSPGTTSYGSTANTAAGLGGGAGSHPLLVPYWGDGTTLGAPAGEGVFFKASTGSGVPAEITWIGQKDFGFATKKDFRVLLYASGTIEFEYGPTIQVEGPQTRYFGVSTRNGIATVPPQTAIGSTVGSSSGASGMCFRTIPTGPVYLADHRITFVPNGTGGWDTATSCGSPVSTRPESDAIGIGCYTIPVVAHDTFYRQFDDFTSAATALSGNSLTLAPVANPPGYTATWNAGGGSSFFPPSAATGTVTSMPVSDDGTTAVAPSVAMPSPFGAAASLVVAHNGILSLGTLNNGSDFSPSGAELCRFNGAGSFYSWADFRDSNPTPVASGVIKHHEETVGADRILFVTWDGVDRWASPQVTNANTWQFQCNLTTGVVHIVWSALNPNSTNPFPGGNRCVVGYSAPGVSGDPGSIDLATALPLTTFPDVPAAAPMSLSIDNLPIVSLPAGTTAPMTWTVTNVPEATQIAPTMRACSIVFSISPAYGPGYDLGVVITPANGFSGCRGYVLTADAFVDVSTLNVTGICTSPTFVFSPPPSLIGAIVTTQAIALAPAGVYFGNHNDIGGHSLWSSNAIQQTYSP